MALQLRHLVQATLVASAFLVPTAAWADDVVVFAAASLKTALDDFAGKWEAETGNSVTISYAGSGQLARQIMQGAPADIFISANPEWMDEVEKAGLVKDGERRDILGNALVLIAHGRDGGKVDIEPGFDLAGLLGDGKLAMALVNSVPAGQYGKAALEALGVWEQVAPSVAQADNVRAALRLVSVGEAPYGIVYRTDAAADDDVTIAGTFPENTHPPIIYPAAVLTEAKDAADATFYKALSGDVARASFEAQGFKVLD